MANPVLETPENPTQPASPEKGATWRQAGLVAFGVLSVAWLGFLLLGQVNARFWLDGEHQIARKSIRGIWAIQLDELPGGTLIQWLVAGSMLVFVVGVIAAFYLLLVAPDDDHDEQAAS